MELTPSPTKSIKLNHIPQKSYLNLQDMGGGGQMARSVLKRLDLWNRMSDSTQTRL